MRHAKAVSGALTLALGACSASGPPAPACPGTAQQTLVNGVADERYLGLAPAQIAAIVQVVSAGKPDGPLCSGTFVAPTWVVTAKHCLQIASPQVVVQGEAQTPVAVYPVVASVGHPLVDVALLQVDVSATDAGADAGADAGLTGVAPMQTGGASVAQLAAGEVVEMAGYGITETGATRSLRFLTESVVAIDGATITVNGFGKSGACEGDSGGPLLIRGPDGSPLVAGVMSLGSATCLQDDTYIRLDAIQDWLLATVGAYVPSPSECGTIPAQGRCLYGSAVWCIGAVLIAQACTGATRCGWDRAEAGFRCVDPLADACHGVDSVGACVGSAAARCVSGTLDRQSCGACGTCRIDGKTGSPGCVSVPAIADAAAP
jgi:V8-like Glu-specific endopeptidase